MSTTFLHDIALNPNNAALLARWDQIALPNAWLVAGCLFQTVWNLHTDRPAESGIKDYDLFYYDDRDLSEAAEQQVQNHVAAVVADLGITVEVANQARVHLWYPDYFGHAYPQLVSAEDGIRRFLVLETCVGVRPNAVHAPYGAGWHLHGHANSQPAHALQRLMVSQSRQLPSTLAESERISISISHTVTVLVRTARGKCQHQPCPNSRPRQSRLILQ